RNRHKLLLPPREHLPRWLPTHSDQHIRAMRPRVRKPPQLVPRSRGLERLSERMLCSPPSKVVQFSDRTVQPGDHLPPERLYLLNDRSSGLRDSLPERRHFHVPRLRCPASRSQRRVALPNRPSVTNPPIRELRFHVEHSPIEPAPPSPPSLLDELVNLRIDHLHRKNPREVRERPHRPGVDTRPRALPPVDLEPDRMDEPPSLRSRTLRPPENHQAPLPVANQPLRIPGTKGPATTQQKHGLEQGGLARAVAAPDEVAARVQRELCLLYAAEVANGELAEDHWDDDVGGVAGRERI